jgi:ubiquinone/menaquinone biosynthesis C-methylase UbiE
MFGLGDRDDSVEITDETEFVSAGAAGRGRLFTMPRRTNVEAHREQFVAAPSAPTPPEHLLHRAGGDADIAGYLRSGHLMACSVDQLIRSRTISIKNQARVLDFGCGCGRLTTWLRSRYVRWDLHGTDTHAESVAWAQSNLKDIANFTCNVAVPPLAYWDGYFDLVIALFVFTQPDNDVQSEWFEELVRVTRPGGHMIVSVAERHERASDAIASMESAPMRVHDWSSFYRTNHRTTDFIRKAWGNFARIEQIVPRWLNQRRALVICRRQ